MAATTKTKKSSKTSKASPFDVNASLLRLEKMYDDLLLKNAKLMQKEYEEDGDCITSEYVVAVQGGSLDWIPIGQVILARPTDDPRLLTSAVSMYCRELSHLATLGSRAFSSLPRNELRYAVEPADSFHKHVYETVMEGKTTLTKARAREILELDHAVDDRNELKSIYRKKSFAYHPDRFTNEEDKATAMETYSLVKEAYETLLSGLRQEGKSWYESLGGKARTEFQGPIALTSMAEAQTVLGDCKVGLCALDPDLVQSFMARCQSS